MEFVPTVAMIALIVKLIDFVRYAVEVTQLATWGAGIVGALLVSQTNWASGIVIGDLPLSRMSVWSLVFAGLSLGSTASLAKDTLKSVDNHNSSAIPTLLATGPKNVRRTKSPTNSEDVG